MAYRLLIVEDEEMDRMGLRLLLSTAFPDLEILPDAINGIELVQIAEKEHIDIAIVDIDMPGLNGIEAIKLLRKISCSARIIMNTAYGEFDYALEALKMHVFDFLLKPMRREKILETVKKCIQTLDKEKSQNDIKNQQVTIFNNLKPTIANEFIMSVISNTIKIENVAMYTALLGVLPEKGFILTSKIICNSENVEKSSIRNKRIYKAFNDYLTQVGSGIVGGVKDDIITVFISLSEFPIDLDFCNWASSFAELLYKKIISDHNLQIHMGIGRRVENIMQLHSSYTDAHKALKECGPGYIVLYDDIYKQESPKDGVPEKKYSKVILDTLKYIQSNYRNDISLEQIADAVGISMFYLSRLFKQELGVKFIDYITDFRINRSKELMSKGDYTVKQLAHLVGYNNHTYFCKLFKKTTSQTISEFKYSLRTIEKQP